MNSISQPVILVIDPDAISLTAIAAILHSANYEVHCAQDSPAALRGAELLQLDLIICDEAVDQQQGGALISQLRQLPDKSDVPLMYVSQNQLPDIIHRPHQCGAAYHLRKPIDPKVLLELVEKALWQLPLINHRINPPHINLAPKGPAAGLQTLV